jgi:hypothetical protein
MRGKVGRGKVGTGERNTGGGLRVAKTTSAWIGGAPIGSSIGEGVGEGSGRFTMSTSTE